MHTLCYSILTRPNQTETAVYFRHHAFLMLTWQWGCGLEQPITFPLFSKIWTHLYFSPSSCSCFVQETMTFKMSSSFISGRVRSECGWKHITRQVPWAGPMLSNGSSDSSRINECQMRKIMSIVMQHVMYLLLTWWRSVRQQSWKVIGEDKGVLIVRIGLRKAQ